MKTIKLNEVMALEFLGNKTPVVGGHVALGADGKVKMHTTAKNLNSNAAHIFMTNVGGCGYTVAKIIEG